MRRKHRRTVPGAFVSDLEFPASRRQSIGLKRRFPEGVPADTLEKVCVQTVESGYMTKDLSLLIGPDQPWLSTTGFLDKIDENLQKAMS